MSTLCLKSGNAAVLKGSRDTHFSNLAIVGLIKNILADYQLEQTLYLAPSEREALLPILTANPYIDLVISRGSQGLIDFVRKMPPCPLLKPGRGLFIPILTPAAT